MMQHLRHTVLFSLLFGAAVSASAATDWLASVPKAERAALKSRIAAIDSALKTMREDYLQASGDEFAYARQARRISALPEALSPESSELYDQRRLRWESARDICQGKYGRTGSSGFVSAADLDSRLEKYGRAFHDAVKPRIAKLKGAALDAFIREAEDRISLYPRCPSSFPSLRSAASTLKESEKRRWAESLSFARLEQVGASFSDELVVHRLAPGDSEKFLAALARFQDALGAYGLYADALQAAAASSWLVDTKTGKNSEFPASAAASIASFLRVVSDTETGTTSLAASEYPILASAFFEILPLAWISYREDPAGFSGSLGLDPAVVKKALSQAWSAVGSAADASSSAPAIDPASILSADRAALSMRVAETPDAILSSYAALRADTSSSRVFSSSRRYADERKRIADALSAAIASAESAASKAVGVQLSRIPVGIGFDPFSPIVLAYKSADPSTDSVDSVIAPAVYGPPLALALAGSLGWIGPSKKPEAAAAWLGDRGIFLSIPVIAGIETLEAKEALLLDSGGAFYPVSGSSDFRGRIADLVAARLGFSAAIAGVPLRFLRFTGGSQRDVSVFYSSAGMLSGALRAKDRIKP